MNQSQIEVNTCNRRQARENVCEQVMIGFNYLLLIGWESGASFSKQSQSVDQSKCELLTKAA